MKLRPLAVVSLLSLGAPFHVFASDSPPSTPSNLSAQNYAGAGGEIFWQRSSDDQVVVGYDITLNGNSIGIMDALSFYDSSIQDGSEITFTVTAVDNTGQRSETASFTLGSNTPDDGNTPDITALNGLRIVRYSTTAAELFWERSATPGLRYEVTRDSTRLGSTDGTSFFDDNLSPDEPFHNFPVSVFDSNGNFVTSELIVLPAGASTGGIPMRPPRVPMPPTGGDSPVLANATILFYSGTAAEIFWTRPEASLGITEVDVFRNGESIGTTNGTSFFDDTRTAGTNYTYELIPRSGSTILAATVVGGTAPTGGGNVPDGTPTDPESIDTDLIIREVLSVINTDALQEALDFTPTNFEDDFTIIDDPESISAVFACPSSGTVARTNGPNPTRTYNDCAVGDRVFNGTYRRAAAAGVNIADFDNFSIVQDDSTLIIEQGSFSDFVSQSGNEAREWDWGDGEATIFSLTTADRSVEATINEVALERTGDREFSAVVNANVTVNGTNVTVSTNDTPLESSNGDVYYTSGQIQISGDDGLNIVIDADGGDASSALITVTSDGSTESETRAWSDEFHVECLGQIYPFEPTSNCN